MIPPTGHYDSNYSYIEKYRSYRKVSIPGYVSKKSKRRSASVSGLSHQISSKKLKPYVAPKKASSLEFAKMKGRSFRSFCKETESEVVVLEPNLSPSVCTKFR